MIKIIKGRLIKEKREYIKTRFLTEEGLFEFFTATAIWYSIIVKYINTIYNETYVAWFEFFHVNFIAEYLSYLSISVIFTFVGLLLTISLIWIFNKIRQVWG